jgi:hypothetical protein
MMMEIILSVVLVGGRWEMEWPRHGGGGVFLGYEEPLFTLVGVDSVCLPAANPLTV